MNKYTNKEFISHTQNISVIRWQSAYLPIVEVIKHINNYQKEKILDFGCGSAAANQIMRKIYDLNIDGVDISPEMIHVAKKMTVLENTEFLRKMVLFHLRAIVISPAMPLLYLWKWNQLNK